MLVSILLPAYNAASTLHATLETVFAQDWTDWEIIIVDDASEDDTLAQAHLSATRYPDQIRVLANAHNEGSGATRNRALAASNGTYIASFDADDLWSASKLRQQVAALEKHSRAGLVWGPGWYANATGEPTRLQEIPLSDAQQLLEPPQLVELLLDGVAPFTSSVMVRRTVAMAVGGYELLRRGQDMSFLYKIATAWPTLYDPQPLCRYRLHEGSSTRWTERNLVYAQRDDAYYRWLAGYLASVPTVAHLAPQAQRLINNQRLLVMAEQAVATLTRAEGKALWRAIKDGADLRGVAGYRQVRQLCSEADGAHMPAETAAAVLATLEYSAANIPNRDAKDASAPA